MLNFLLHCPHLRRDVSDVLARVPDVQVITGYPTTPGEAGCLAMHQEAVRRAKNADAPYCFVMEDDCMLTDAFVYSRWAALARWAFEHGYGAVHGGTVRMWNPREVAIHYGDEMDIEHPLHVLEVDRCCSAHCMIYTKHGYDAVWAAEQPFDLTIADKGIRPVLVWPFVAIQRAGLSGIGPPTHGGIATTYHGPQEVNYEGLFRMQEGHIGHVLGLIH